MLFLFLVLSFCISCHEIEGRRNTQLERQYSSSSTLSQDRKLESILLTMDNDFHCIDIYKQPAFEHPLLKNHKIQLNPTFARDRMQKRLPNIGKVVNVDNFTKGCPLGKVPIHKIKDRHQKNTSSSLELEIKGFHQYSQSYPGHHFSTLDTTQNTTYHGASARFGLYNLSIYVDQYSISQIWLQNGPPVELNSIQVGWAVHPILYGDNALHLTTNWTVDNYQTTGCYNYLCPGFVQVDPKIYLGGSYVHANVIGSSDKYDIDIKVKQDQSTGHWWLIIKDTIQIGYWPKEIFTHLSEGSSLIRYGGETFSPTYIISPPMGSGQLPKMSFYNAAYIARLQIVDSEYNEHAIDPDHMKSYSDTSSNCYDLLYHGYQGQLYEQALLFGGPGGQCGI